tara:strand:- start:42518 stop:43513 length:996 start_codon:yes stop_codon:yes gene_type:complete
MSKSMTAALCGITLACLAEPVHAQISASNTITTTLVSSGNTGCGQSTWSQSIPVGPLPSPAALPNYSWTQTPNSVGVTSNGFANTCGFFLPPDDFSYTGTVQVELTAPFLTTCDVQVVGNYSASGGYGSTTVSGAVQATLGGFFNPVPSVNQVTTLTIGPAPTTIVINHSNAAFAQFGFTQISMNLTVSWSVVDAASATSYGVGCQTGAPVQTATSVPQLGGAMQANITQVPGPNPIGFTSIGFSNTSANPGSLPFPLTAIGMTNCFLLQSAELTAPALASSASSLNFDIALPSDPIFLGVNLFTQAFCLAPGVNPLQVLTSNGMRWQLGT